ncbi:glycosyltransferase family 4 protein [Gluconobacter wancherniae]|uniref:glycosyltransferase family 4 protein n=1 Tax=Gluconobacter wancherniae TaxID=1307955 RepID=UPI001B8C33C0|nr:glycosyltransferase family 1 protein [Gluconobacter wancherniae]MBS1088292.1 glycosyltransferase family 4 protein [Gluconobacter wancherniae]
MQIVLDARNTGRAMGTGVTTYTNTLAAALTKQGSSTISWLRESPSLGVLPAVASHSRYARYIRFFKALTSQKLLASCVTSGTTDLISNDLFRIGHVHFNIYGRPLPIVADTQPDLMHWTYPLPFTMMGCPNIVTIHDLIPILNPEFCTTNPERMQKLLQCVIERADKVVTISNTVRQDILTHFNLPPQRVCVIHQATNIPEELEALRYRKLGPAACPIGGFLYMGTIERRKNIGRLIRAHARSRTTRPLILIGPEGFGAQEELAALNDHPYPERVLRLPWMLRDDLLCAIQEARAVVFPSLAEGFGLPIIEAMALGVPVLTSLGGTTEEIAGQAAYLVDPLDVDSITEGLIRLDREELLHTTLVNAGSRHVQYFNMQDYGARFSALYRDVLASK